MIKLEEKKRKKTRNEEPNKNTGHKTTVSAKKIKKKWPAKKCPGLEEQRH